MFIYRERETCKNILRCHPFKPRGTQLTSQHEFEFNMLCGCKGFYIIK